MREPLLDKLDRKFGRYALRNLMLIIVIGTAIVWLLDTVLWYRAEVTVSQWLSFYREAILSGQVWRVLTFLFIPEEYNVFFLLLSLYIDFLIGSALEREWGALRFDLYYFCGVLCAIGSGFITGYATNYYLNLSLFLAFAILNPDYKLLLFFFIPIKVKWLAIVDAVGLVLLFIFTGWEERIALLVSLINVLLLFGGIVVRKLRAVHRRRKWKKESKRDENNYPFDL